MPRKPQTKAKSPARRKSKTVDPTGRVDLLAARLIERAAANSGNPLLSALHQELAPELGAALTRYLGPSNKRLATVQRLVKRAVNVNARMGVRDRDLDSKSSPRVQRAQLQIAMAGVRQ